MLVNSKRELRQLTLCSRYNVIPIGLCLINVRECAAIFHAASVPVSEAKI